MLCAAHAAAQESAWQQAERVADKEMARLLQAEARRQGWQGMRYQLSHQPLGRPAAQPCSQPLRASSSGNTPSPLQRQRFELSCADGWQLTLLSQAEVFLPVVFSQGALERGQTIAAGDLKLAPINIAKAPQGFFNHLEPVVGKRAKRRIRAGQVLHPGLLAAPWLVRRGQQVTIIASDQGIQAAAKGEALSNGQRDALIRVRNLSSGKTIQAKVIDEGVVSSTFQ